MRQYLSQTAPDKKGLLAVSGKDYRYMRQVLRLCAGDMLLVRLPDGTPQQMTVCKVDEATRNIVLQLCAQTEENGGQQKESLPELDVWLFQFVAKGAKMDTIVRQATECGVSTIVPVLGEFSQAHGAEKNFRSERLLRIIREARQQSGSPVETRILDAVSVEQALSLWQDYCRTAECADSVANGCGAVVKSAGGKEGSFAAVLYERTEQTVPLHTALGKLLSCGNKILRAALAVGAEGGISPAEIDLLCGGGFVPVHFKTNILRCETAALYGIAALQNAITENDIWQCKE